jgi:dipeptidyl aminopeptidase/acylaminoacyl peptidase
MRFDHIQLDGDDVYWLEGRASEGGRYVIVKTAGAAGAAGATGATGIVDVTPPGFNVRSRVHEYGGAAYTVHQGTIYFANFTDQRVYRHRLGETPVPITDDGAFYADMRVDALRNRVISVREKDGVNSIVAIAGATGATGATGVLVDGADFYSDPIISPDGTRLAWLQWNHPNMPWDGTELWEESIFQPEWSPDGALYFVSDRTGWWNLWRGDEPMYPMAADFGKPQWTFSMVTYAFVSPRTIAATYVQQGRWKLAVIDVDTKTFEPIELPLQPLEGIRANEKAIYFIGGSATHAPAIARVDYPPERGRHTMDVEVLRRSTAEGIPHGWISVAVPVTFKVTDRDVHAFYYAPTNPEVDPPSDEKPPLLVVTHGGPTGATSDVLDPKILFWTSRGFAVLDVDYSGSTGYGRTYRDRLKGQWGIVDVEDAVGGAEAMVAEGKPILSG